MSSSPSAPAGMRPTIEARKTRATPRVERTVRTMLATSVAAGVRSANGFGEGRIVRQTGSSDDPLPLRSRRPSAHPLCRLAAVRGRLERARAAAAGPRAAAPPVGGGGPRAARRAGLGGARLARARPTRGRGGGPPPSPPPPAPPPPAPPPAP